MDVGSICRPVTSGSKTAKLPFLLLKQKDNIPFGVRDLRWSRFVVGSHTLT